MDKSTIIKTLREMAKHPTVTLPRDCEALKAAADMIEQAQQVDKEGSPYPEFWDWLPKAYNFDGDGTFTKYNMEVAFLAGKQSVEQAQKQEPVAYKCGDAIVYIRPPIYGDTSPPPRKPLTDEQREEIAKRWRGRNWTLGDVIDAVESAHGIKGDA